MNCTIPHSRPAISAQDHAAVHKVLNGGMVACGELVQELEREVSAYLGTAGAVATSTGTAALQLALSTLGVRAGDEVILPTYVCPSVRFAVLQMEAVPVYCDCGRDNWVVDAETVRRVVTKSTKAIIVAHVLGICANVESLLDTGIPVVEDCAQSFGGRVNGQLVGTIGDIGVLSFQATKCLTTGEGGMAITSDPNRMQKMAELHRSQFRLLSPLSDLQAMLGLSQLRQYDSFLRRRREIADQYFQSFPDCVTKRLSHLDSMFFRFPLWLPCEFPSWRQTFHDHGVQVRQGVDALLHRTDNQADERFPSAVEAFRRSASIPIYPSLSKREISRIMDAVHAAVESMPVEVLESSQ